MQNRDRRSGTERRNTDRYPVEIDVEWDGPQGRQAGTVSDVSMGGCFVLSSGEIDLMRKLNYGTTALGQLPTGEVIAGDERGNVTSLNGSDKALWRFKSGGGISNVFAAGQQLIATSHDNFVYFLLTSNGDVIWKKRMSGRVSQIGKVLDRYVLIASFEENSAVLTELSNGKAVGQTVFGEKETLVAPPVSVNGLILVLTDRAGYAYSLNGCAANKEAAGSK